MYAKTGVRGHIALEGIGYCALGDCSASLLPY